MSKDTTNRKNLWNKWSRIGNLGFVSSVIIIGVACYKCYAGGKENKSVLLILGIIFVIIGISLGIFDFYYIGNKAGDVV